MTVEGGGNDGGGTGMMTNALLAAAGMTVEGGGNDGGAAGMVGGGGANPANR